MKEYFTVLEACKELGKSKYQIRQLIKKGELEVKPFAPKEVAFDRSKVSDEKYLIMTTAVEMYRDLKKSMPESEARKGISVLVGRSVHPISDSTIRDWDRRIPGHQVALSGQVGRIGYQILASSLEAWKIRQAEIKMNAEPPPILFAFRARMTRKEFKELDLSTSERAMAFREFAERKKSRIDL